MNWYCPVCYRPVQQTPQRNIFGHFDKSATPCPGSYEPFRIALGVTEPSRDVDYVSHIPKWWPKKRKKRVSGAKAG